MSATRVVVATTGSLASPWSAGEAAWAQPEKSSSPMNNGRVIGKRDLVKLKIIFIKRIIAKLRDPVNALTVKKKGQRPHDVNHSGAGCKS
jgi:hypothetical protein